MAVDIPPPPDISGIDLAAPGTTLDDSPASAALEFDLSGLSLAPAESASLEDCVVEKPARKISDITHLALVNNE